MAKCADVISFLNSIDTTSCVTRKHNTEAEETYFIQFENKTNFGEIVYWSRGIMRIECIDLKSGKSIHLEDPYEIYDEEYKVHITDFIVRFGF